MNSPNELSFLPDDYLERKAQRRTNAICAMLFLIVVIGAIGVGVHVHRAVDARGRAAVRTTSSSKYTEAAKRIEQVQQLQEKQRTMAQQAELTASLLEKVPRSFLLAELTNALPPGVSLLDLRAGIEAAQVAGPRRRRRRRSRSERRQVDRPSKRVAGIAGRRPSVYDVTMKLTGVAEHRRAGRAVHQQAERSRSCCRT